MTGKQLKITLAGMVSAVALFSIGSRGASTTLPTLSASDVQTVVEHTAASVDAPMVIAVTDRQGDILAVFLKPGASAVATANFGAQAATYEVAIALARTASFFSNSQAPLSSRTVRYISGIHFPPGIPFTGNAALYGIENTNRGCGFNTDFLPGQSVPASRSIDGSQPGLGILTGKADLNDSDPTAVNPGGVPLFKNGILVGGVGVAGVDPNVAEFAAFSGEAGFGPIVPSPGVVFIDGIALPFVNQTTMPAGYKAGSAKGGYIVMPKSSPGPAPEGDLIAAQAGKIGGLTLEEVASIVNATVATGNQTRAIIRLPLGSRARFAIAVADLDGTLLALHRMPDATIFSLDVAVAKSRNVIFFSGPHRTPGDLPGVPMGTAVTNRTISFGAQPFFPPGIDYSTPGPFFNLYQYDTLHACTQGSQVANKNQNGIVFFPGALPLYKNGVLVGGLGVSGDGVDQDDFATAAGAANFQAPTAIRADQVFDQGVRLPYIKFPRNPTD
ncbi:MAG TPA: heme-binding protein [Bryobacteraceae bacterium]|jgi:uncharacterized protein GlcG (DUF336 family)|nr:heme-binding protein [Bryobacteraceae bacterium]